MIMNLKLYRTMSGSGSPAVLVKLWTRQACHRASVPLPPAGGGKAADAFSPFSSIRSNFVGLNEEDWQSFDAMLSQLGDGIHPSLSLAMSLACARAATGGDLWKLAGGKSRFPYIAGIVAQGSSWKEFMLMPRSERTVLEAFSSLSEAWKVIGEEMKAHGVLRGRAASGAWISDLADTEMLYLVAGVAKDWGMDVGVNVSAGRLWDGSAYGYSRVPGTMKKELSPQEQMSLVSAVMEHYRIGYVEDPFHGADYTSHSQLTQKFPEAVVSGGGLYRGDVSRMKMAYKYRTTGAVTLGYGDMPTVSRLSEAYDFTRGKGLKLCLSASESETEDSWISDLSIAFGANIIKLGVSGVGSTAKYARFLEIWEEASEPSMGKLSA